MKTMIGKRVLIAVSVILVFCTVNALGKEGEFPVMAINLYVGFGPGGGIAQTGMILSEGMKKYLKQPVFINFKPGASQLIAAESVKNSKPDGYTLFYLAFQSLIAKVVTEGPTSKFRLEDLDSLGAGPYTPMAFAVNAESPWKTVEDLIAAARKSPGKVNLGHGGLGIQTHMKAELFSIQNGIVLNSIPHGGTGPVVTALLGKHIDIGIGSSTAFGAHILPGGGLRALVVFDHKRIALAPDAPTAIERGINITAIESYGLLAPKGLPKSVRATLVQAFKNTVEDPEIASALKKLVGIQIDYHSPEEIDKKIQKEYKELQDVWEKVGSLRK